MAAEANRSERLEMCFDTLATALGIDSRDSDRRLALRSDLQQAIASLEAGQRTDFYSSPAAVDQFIKQGRRAINELKDFVNDPLFGFFTLLHGPASSHLNPYIRSLTQSLTRFAQEADKMRETGEVAVFFAQSPVKEFIAVDLRRIFRVYAELGSSGAAGRLDGLKVRGQTHPDSAFIAFAVLALNELGIENHHGGDWMAEAVIQTIKRRTRTKRG